MTIETPVALTKIQEIASELRHFKDNLDSVEQAEKARRLLKKYAVLSEAIERNVLVCYSPAHKKTLATIRTEEFKSMRRALKEKANSILHSTDKKKAPVKSTPKTAVKAATPKQDTKEVAPKATKKEAKAATPKKSTKEAAPKAKKTEVKAAAPKKSTKEVTPKTKKTAESKTEEK